MLWRKWNIGCFSFLLVVLSVSNLCCTVSARSDSNSCEEQTSQVKPSILSPQQLQQRAENISVKVMAPEIIGTGFLLKKTGLRLHGGDECPCIASGQSSLSNSNFR